MKSEWLQVYLPSVPNPDMHLIYGCAIFYYLYRFAISSWICCLCKLMCAWFMKMVLLICGAWIIFHMKVINIPWAIILFSLPQSLFSDICHLLDDGLELEIQSEDYGIFPFCRMNGPLPELTCDLTSLVLYLKLIYSPLKLLLTNN